MANRRKTPKKQTKKESRTSESAETRQLSGTIAAPKEAIGVILSCIGILTLLSLGSFAPGDISLNASGSLAVENWIGPAGAYWADLLLQGLGIGAFALGTGLLLAGWRAFTGKRVSPGWREISGTLLLVVSLGTFSHLFFVGVPRPYPAGGLMGALLGQVLFEQFAIAGAYIISGSFVLVSLALTADGVLSGFGHRGLGVMKSSISHLQAGFVLLEEHRERLNERRLELAESRAEKRALAAEEERSKKELGEQWTLGEILRREKEEESRQEAKETLLNKARELGKKLGDAHAKHLEQKAEKREKVHQRSARREEIKEEFSKDLEATEDLSFGDEESFELGVIEELLDELGTDEGTPVVRRHAEVSQGDTSELDGDFEEFELHPDDVDEEIPIRAALPAFTPIQLEAPTNSLVEPSSEDGELPQIVDVRPEVDADEIERAAEESTGDVVETSVEPFQLPPASLLGFEQTEREEIDEGILQENAVKLTKTLRDYRISGHVREIRPGPIVTMYEYKPEAGTKVSKIAGLSDDLAMSMEALRVRIVAPIPGKGAVGIEIPNLTRETVYFKEVIAHESFRESKKRLPLVLGKDIEGKAAVADWARMPHLLVAGATGSGKSVFVNNVIMSILFKKTPDDVRFLMIDPKMLELSVYDGIPHLLLPVVTDPKKATLALRWAVDEMESRYQLLSDMGVRHIDGYNKKVADSVEEGRVLRRPSKDEDLRGEACEHLPYIVIIVDELADLMMTASKDVESSIMRLAQKARAAGIHLLLATQRPSVDVLTGVIKANFPTRIAFQVACRADSRTILDSIGAENLLGMGDMLYQSPGGSLERVHGAYVTDEEIDEVVTFLKEQGEPSYREEILAPREEESGEAPESDSGDEMYDQAIAIVAESQKASISFLQRRLRVGYNRAARMIERMESEGIVGPADGSKGRQIYANPVG